MHISLKTIDTEGFIICMKQCHRISPHIIILCQNLFEVILQHFQCKIGQEPETNIEIKRIRKEKFNVVCSDPDWNRRHLVPSAASHPELQKQQGNNLCYCLGYKINPYIQTKRTMDKQATVGGELICCLSWSGGLVNAHGGIRISVNNEQSMLLAIAGHSGFCD